VKRILFVDDEPRILEGLNRMLRPHRHEWEMVFAAGGEQALAELEKAPFDVVVSDMRMPGIDGLALLTTVRERYPDAARIILSGFSEVDTALRTIPIAHQFLSKPCDAAVIRNVVQRAGQIQELLRNDTIRRYVGGIASLPSCPRVYNELNAALANPDTSIAEITRIVEHDVGISARILQVVNSGFFGMPRRVTSVQNAVGYLGAGMIKNLALSIGVFQAFGEHGSVRGFSIDAEQHHAFLSANIAGSLFEERQLSSEAFTAAMLQNVGVLILATRMSEEYERVIAERDATSRPDFEVETRLLGFNHPEIGAYLLGLWGLPFPIVEAVAFHHTPERLEQGAFDAASAVYVADHLAREVAPHAGNGDLALDEALLARLGVLGELPKWRAHAEKLAAVNVGSPEVAA